ncbi:MAG: thermostable hemolysin delta-VPH [Ruminococcaceae bacterium]|nr:thermostable hemolysin delta-VPH [Oscillospiraceae bacterium]
MLYYNYHATAKRLIKEGKLTGYFFTEHYKNISPALVLLFDDAKHPVMPIREYRFDEYLPLLPDKKEHP